MIRPDATRKYEIRTFGTSDTVMVLFEDENGELRYLAGDDDSGEDYNAHLQVKLLKGPQIRAAGAPVLRGPCRRDRRHDVVGPGPHGPSSIKLEGPCPAVTALPQRAASIRNGPGVASAFASSRVNCSAASPAGRTRDGRGVIMSRREAEATARLTGRVRSCLLSADWRRARKAAEKSGRGWPASVT